MVGKRVDEVGVSLSFLRILRLPLLLSSLSPSHARARAVVPVALALQMSRCRSGLLRKGGTKPSRGGRPKERYGPAVCVCGVGRCAGVVPSALPRLPVLTKEVGKSGEAELGGDDEEELCK